MKEKYSAGIIILSCLLTLFLVSVSPVFAVGPPPGESSAVNGAENYYAGALPPPGFHIIDYTFFYSATKFMGPSGDKDSPPGFHVTALANVIRPIYVADVDVLGANPAWHLIIPIVYQKVSVNGTSSNKFGIGDIYFSPLILGWHREVFHWVAALDIIAPTGSYDIAAVNGNNIGKNHWTFEPAFAISAITKQGFTASAKFMYDIHTENQDTKATCGDQIHIDYSMGYKIHDNWDIGLGGYYLKGLQDDTQDGVKVADSKQEVLAIGPNVRFSKGKLSIVLEPDFEVITKNRTQGIATWLKLVYSF